MQRRRFGIITGLGGGAMGFDQGDGFRSDTGFIISPGQGRDLAFRFGNGQSFAASVAGGTNGFNNGIYRITVPFRIGQAL